MLIVALLPTLVAVLIFVGTFRLRRGARTLPRVTILPPAPSLPVVAARLPDVAAARRAVAATRIDDQRAA